jgi:hypothetical protein
LLLVQEGNEYTRKVYSVNQFLANIGGLLGTVTTIFAGAVWVFQYYGQNLDVVFDAFDVLEEQDRRGIAEPGATISKEDIEKYKPYLKTREYDGNTFTLIRTLLPKRC